MRFVLERPPDGPRRLEGRLPLDCRTVSEGMVDEVSATMHTARG
jgi:hypothetical protein